MIRLQRIIIKPIEIDPEDAGNYYDRARLYDYNLKQYDKAEVDFNKAH